MVRYRFSIEGESDRGAKRAPASGALHDATPSSSPAHNPSLVSDLLDTPCGDGVLRDPRSPNGDHPGLDIHALAPQIVLDDPRAFAFQMVLSCAV